MRDVDAFLAAAGGYLGEHEAEHNLLFGICSTVQSFPGAFVPRPWFHVVRQERQVVGAAIRTPPRPLVISELASQAALVPLVEATRNDRLPGVTAPTGVAAAFANAWSAETAGRAELQVAERIYRLERVIPPRPAPGGPRLATGADVPLLIDWINDFAAEALPEPQQDPEGWAERATSGIGGRAVWLWEVDGTPVSLAGVGGPTPNGIRIGPVCTPPMYRNRGFAGNVVAAASSHELAAGKRFVFLFTDLSNATSNHVYQAIGFEPVADVDQWRFTPPGS